MKVARITYITQMYSFEIFQDGGRPDAILDLIEPEKAPFDPLTTKTTP